MTLAVVVLPQPDSPMIPRVSPRFTVKSTPSTAFTQAGFRFRRRPCLTPKYFLRPRASRRGLAMGDLYLVIDKPTARQSSITEAEIPGLFQRAPRHRHGTAGMKMASCRQVRQIRRLTRNGIEGLLTAELWHRAEQGFGVGMFWIREELPNRTVFDDL